MEPPEPHGSKFVYVDSEFYRYFHYRSFFKGWTGNTGTTSRSAQVLHMPNDVTFYLKFW